jgi:CO/xanthine dehydrogenase FAD-binding subunit
VPVLLTLDATVVSVGGGGERTVALEEFLIGPGRTTRRSGELVTAVRFASPPERSASAFLKAGRRRAMEISVVCVAARLTLDATGERCANARVVLGAVAPTTWRARDAERVLEGREPTPAALREAGRAAAAECRPISDVRASARYRRLLVETLVPRALARCIERLRNVP